jgi:hypothetical protein
MRFTDAGAVEILRPVRALERTEKFFGVLPIDPIPLSRLRLHVFETVAPARVSFKE